MVAESEFRELGRQLRALAETSPLSRSDLAAWHKRSCNLELSLRQNAQLCDSLPHFVWHYLADADIRVKDAIYRADQQVLIYGIISALERGELPPDAT